QGYRGHAHIEREGDLDEGAHHLAQRGARRAAEKPTVFTGSQYAAHHRAFQWVFCHYYLDAGGGASDGAESGEPSEDAVPQRNNAGASGEPPHRRSAIAPEG